MATWLTWSALSLVAAVVTGIAAGGLLPRLTIEACVLAFAVGMAWSAATPRILRHVSRRVR